MKRIRKRRAPPALTDWARRLGTPTRPRDWSELPGKISPVLRSELDAEQGGICCYCCMSLKSGGHIEHFVSRHRDPSRMFDYGNLHLSCMGALEHAGREPVDPAAEHCGSRKDQDAAPAPVVDPQAPDCESYFRFTGGGDIRASKEVSRSALAKQTIEVLGLNCAPLRRMRAAAVDTALAAVDRLSHADWVRQYLEPDTNGHYAEFQPAIRYHYEKDWHRWFSDVTPDGAGSGGR